MGAYASNFDNDSGSLVSEVSHPTQDSWIPAHAAATGLNEVEVSRLWQRFQQLGADADGRLPQAVLEKPPATEDIFVRNILSNLRLEADHVRFQTFLNAMKWAETSTLEEKVKATFALINGGEVISTDLLNRVLRRVYPEDSEAAVARLTSVFMEQIDDKKQGYITEAQFVGWVQTLPAETLAAILDFQVIPTDIEPPPPPSIDALSSRRLSEVSREADTRASKKIPTEDQLRDVAKSAQKKDWHRLANQLGFTADEIADFQKKYPRQVMEQIYGMLMSWRDGDGESATVAELETALRECGMGDIASQA